MENFETSSRYAGIAGAFASMIDRMRQEGELIRPEDIGHILVEVMNGEEDFRSNNRDGIIPDPYCGRRRGVRDPVGHGSAGGSFNLYPGMIRAGCCKEAFFVSLSCRSITGGWGRHLNFRSAIEKLIQHMATCRDITTTAVILTDSWDANAYFEWASNINHIKQYTHLEVYLMAGGKTAQMMI